MRVGQLSLVQRDNHDQQTRADTRDETPAVQVVERLSCCLDHSADEEDDGAGGEGGSSTEPVTERTGDGGTDYGADGETTYD